MKKYLSKGFTLVELLIVIALLGVIATIVIAAINPIEQANRAHDSQFKSDSSQLLSAIERYYVANSKYPWNTANGTTYPNPDTAFGFMAANDGLVGICFYPTACATDGNLISALELKTGFRTRNFISDATTTDGTKRIWIGKASSSSASVYACYIPLSKSIRDTACAGNRVWTVNASTGARTAVGAATCGVADAWANNIAGYPGSAWMICVPE